MQWRLTPPKVGCSTAHLIEITGRAETARRFTQVSTASSEGVARECSLPKEVSNEKTAPKGE